MAATPTFQINFNSRIPVTQQGFLRIFDFQNTSDTTPDKKRGCFHIRSTDETRISFAEKIIKLKGQMHGGYA